MNLHVKDLSLYVKQQVNVPSPSSLSYMWNLGSLLGVCLFLQVVSGLFLSFHYSSYVEEAFNSVVKISEEVNLGWMIRFIHANGASFFFATIYLHMARGLYYKSFNLVKVWLVGCSLLLLLMETAFLGYVLPWGQMSLWGATVITNLLSSLPMGSELVVWVWGGYSVSGPTLVRFYSLHYFSPFVIIVLVLSHLIVLHEKGSSNPLGVGLNVDKVPFHPLFTWKDMVGVVVFVLALMSITLNFPDVWMDPDNFSPANPLSTPEHIQPEWYFLFAYAILRSVPNKLGGVIGLILSVGVLFFLPFLGKEKSSKFNLLSEIFFWTFCLSFVSLTYLGTLPAEGIFILLSRVFSISYFISLLLM